MHLPDELTKRLTERAPRLPGGTSIGNAATVALTRYFALLNAGATHAARLLTAAERDYLRDILNGTFLDETGIPLMDSEVADAEPAYAEKWGIDADALAEKLRAAPLPTLYAIADDVEIFWKGGTA